ncbi:MAG TPA: hypothetical protein PLO89_12350, partial [Spirochaetota bacterium]|nr:hypothetical protein [Spirochaetota bacterium]
GENHGAIENCSVLGTNPSNHYVTAAGDGDNQGGFIVGGLVGKQNSSGSIKNCFSSIKAFVPTGWGYKCGGLVGEFAGGSMIDCYAVGEVKGKDQIGGLVGLFSSGSVTNSYSTGAVTGETNVGGLIGRKIGGTITASYYDMETSGRIDDDKGEKKTTVQMKDTLDISTNYSGWDFANTWGIDENINNGYPYLINNAP